MRKENVLPTIAWFLALLVPLFLAAGALVATWTSDNVTTAGALAITGVVLVPLALVLVLIDNITEYRS